MNVNATLTLLEDLLATEEATGTTRSYTDFMGCVIRRNTINQSYQSLATVLGELRQRVHNLPKLVTMEVVQWAKAVQQFPNLAFLEVDTDGLSDDADIIRLVVLDNQGQTLYNQTVKPRRPLPQKIVQITGVHQEMLEHAPSLKEMWPEFIEALAGKYVLSFNFEFDEGKLSENATRYQVAPIKMIGDCLMQQSMNYYHDSPYPKLATLCSRIGFPLPEHPLQTALDRANGQLHLLQAMSQGIASVEVQDAALGELDDHPL